MQFMQSIQKVYKSYFFDAYKFETVNKTISSGEKK